LIKADEKYTIDHSDLVRITGAKVIVNP